MRRAVSRAQAAVAFASILAIAAWARLAVFPMVFARGEFIPALDGDSYYHLHRTLETIRDFPRVPHFDPGMNWPKGAFCPWADGFDLSGALFALMLGGGSDRDVARIAIGLWPVVLGLLAVAATYRMVRVALPGSRWVGAALAAAAGAALIPGGITTALFGRIDHHVFEALLLLLLVTWAMRAQRAHPSGPPPRPWGFEVEGAVLCGLAVYGFSGSPLYVALTAVPLVAVALRTGHVLGSGGVGMIGGGLVGALLTIPYVLDTGLPWTFRFPSFLQPLFVAACGVLVATSGWIAGAAPAGRRRRVLLALAVAVAGALAVGIGTAALANVREAIVGWLFHKDPWLARVQEFSPMFASGPGQPPIGTRLHQEFGWAGFLYPISLIVIGARLRDRPRIRTLLFVALAATALALLSNRFSRVLVPLMAACNGIAIGAVLQGFKGRRSWARAPIWAPLLVTVGSLLDLPTSALLIPPRPRVSPIVDAAIQLRDLPPPPATPRGVLSNWTYGHHVQVVAGRPVVVNGFGSFLDSGRFWKAVEVFKGSSGALDDFMTANQLGVLIAGPATIGNEVTGADESVGFAGGALNKVYMQSLPLSPLLIAGSAVPGWDVPHLPHLMPRYASSAIVTGLGFPLPFVWTYERVEGARVRGLAPPGARVLAELPFTEHRRAHVYKAFTEAGPDGSWEIVLPFPSGRRESVFRSAPEWTVSAGGGAPVPFRVSEQDVREGRVVTVGALPAPPPGG